MRLEKIKQKKHESAQFMADEITHIIKTFGKRDPGSEGEKKAVEYMAEQLKPLCDEVTVEPFDVYPASFMGWIYITVTLVLAGVVAYFFAPIVTVALILIGATLMIGQFVLYRQMIDKLFKKKTSYNITAVKHPVGEVKRRIFFNGHPDAACEWTMNYHFGGVGFVAHFIIAVVGVVYAFAVSILAVIKGMEIGWVHAAFDAGLLRTLGLIMLAFVPFWIGMYFLWNEKIVVDGANDNLTGCYMGIALMKALKDEGVEFENTEVGVIISGSEEAGLRGAKAWCKAHKDDYKDVETLIFAFDTIHEGEFLYVNDRDLNLTVKADRHASDLFKNSADELGIKCSVGAVPLGATDSAAFNQGGFKATGITAMDHNLKDYYHTRRDSYDNLDLGCLADCYEVTVQTLKNFDEGK